MADELTRPLLGRQKRKGGGVRPVGIALTLLGAALVGGVIWTIVSWDPDGAAVVPIADAAPGSSGDVVIRAPEEGDTGVRITTPEGTALNGGGVVIRELGAAEPVTLATTPNPDLVEAGPYGPLPRVAASGLRPIDAYARPPAVTTVTGRPQIAIIIGGLGLNAAGTEQAFAQLPVEVSLALAPYAPGLPAWASRARAAGHEIFLQVPLEPFDYPANNPGEHTLLVDDPAATNLERLQWLMAQFQMYAGVLTYAGGRFTADTAALDPFVTEIGRRGLMLVDEGASARSLTAQIAVGVVPYARADLVLDALSDPAAVRARLAQLEVIARDRGYAVASGSAFPMTIDAIRSWAVGLAGRGFDLVPITALKVDPAGTTAIQVP